MRHPGGGLGTQKDLPSEVVVGGVRGEAGDEPERLGLGTLHH